MPERTDHTIIIPAAEPAGNGATLDAIEHRLSVSADTLRRAIRAQRVALRSYGEGRGRRYRIGPDDIALIEAAVRAEQAAQAERKAAQAAARKATLPLVAADRTDRLVRALEDSTNAVLVKLDRVLELLALLAR